MNESEHIEYLGSGVKLIVSESHTFGTDALLLADFTSPKRKDIACDFGTGCGIIPFYWLRENMGRKIYAVEIQKNGFEILKRSVELNGAGEKIIPLNTDLRDLKNADYAGRFDVISMNPPYTPDGAGIKSSSDSAKIARHETICSLGEICLTASMNGWLSMSPIVPPISVITISASVFFATEYTKFLISFVMCGMT